MSLRSHNKTLIYLRRSTSRPEFDARGQLACIITEVAKVGVVLDAKIDDLDHMEQAGLNRFRGIVLENGFRPGKGRTG